MGSVTINLQGSASAHRDIIVRSFLTSILSGGSCPGSPVSQSSTWLRLSNPDASKAVCLLRCLSSLRSLEPPAGFEPATYCLQNNCSTN